MAIHLIKECNELKINFRGLTEKCFFECGNNADTWHAGTNQPVCPDCAKVRKTSELTLSSPKYIPITKAEYKCSCCK